MSAPLRLGTRGSALALAQSGQVASTLTAATGREVELVRVVTRGDTTSVEIPQLGSTGVFVTALRDALLAGKVDLAVHSYKDLPTAPAEGLVIGARIGTGAPRRIAQLRALGLGHAVEPVRGNVDTRIGYVTGGSLDAVVLARAGLARLGRLGQATEVLDPLQMLPAPAQGALAIECCEGELVATLAVLDDELSRCAVAAERALLAALEAGCSAPVAALAEVAEGDDGPEIYLRGLVAAIDGSSSVRLSATGPTSDPAGVGRRLAAELLDLGAAALMGER